MLKNTTHVIIKIQIPQCNHPKQRITSSQTRECAESLQTSGHVWDILERKTSQWIIEFTYLMERFLLIHSCYNEGNMVRTRQKLLKCDNLTAWRDGKKIEELSTESVISRTTELESSQINWWEAYLTFFPPEIVGKRGLSSCSLLWCFGETRHYQLSQMKRIIL